MSETNKGGKRDSLFIYAPLAGVILVISGLLLFIDQRLVTGWIAFTIPGIVGLVFIGYGLYKKNQRWMVSGLIITGLGLALILMLSNAIKIDTTARVGFSLLGNAVIWFALFFAVWPLVNRKPWWALFVAVTCGALTYIFLTGRFTLLDFVFFLSIAIGLVFLLWGSFKGKMGLIIPGALLIAIGAGVYFGWSNPDQPGGLQKTGNMLVWFAFGWGLITVFSRIIHKRFTWWPLIPGGILLMVGSGLYIGGNPENALGFLGNTGSIGLILVGAYLIFLKFGMKR